MTPLIIHESVMDRVRPRRARGGVEIEQKVDVNQNQSTGTSYCMASPYSSISLKLLLTVYTS